MELLKDKILQVEQELAALEQEVAQLESKLKQATNLLNTNKSALDGLVTQETKLKNQLKSAQSKVTKLNKDISATNADIKRRTTAWMRTGGRPPMPAALASAIKKFGTLKKQQKQHVSTVNKIKKQLVPFPGKISKARAQWQNSKKPAVQLQIDLQKAQNLTAGLSIQLQELQAEAARLDELHSLLGELPKADLPVALLPAGIETRFVVRDNRNELLIRIYPDSLHLDTHEPELTKDEETWGQHFWQQTWRAGRRDDEDAEAQRKRAWAQLAQRFGLYRAAWVSRVMEPLNPKDRPVAPVPDDKPLVKTPRFSKPASRAESWTRAPETRVLPDRWVVLGYREEKRVLFEWGEQVPDLLPAGPSPQAQPPKDISDDKLVVDEGMRWLIDFAEAEKLGMGLRVELDEKHAELGFDTLMVLGLKTSLDSAAGAERLAKLLDAQHYSDGLAFVPQGTPTNNTEDAPSGYSSVDPGYELSYRVERRDPLFEPGSGTNGDITAKALGIPPDVFHHVWHAEKHEQPDARSMNTALWGATWGYFLEQMMAETFSIFGIRQGRRHFIDYVRARGSLPILRIGRQPYGLLPVTSLGLWVPQKKSDIDTELIPFLNSLRDLWRQAVPHVPRIDSNNQTNSEEENLLHVLGMEATSVSYSARPILDLLFFGTSKFPAIPVVPPQSRSDIDQRIQRGRDMLNRLGLNWNPRLFETIFAQHDFPLAASLVQSGPLSEKVGLNPNYIEWLRSTDYLSIHNESYPNTFPEQGTKLNSLLYLLLRHSTLLEYSNTAFRILLNEGIVESWEEHREPALVDILNIPTSTVGRFIDETIPNLGDGPISKIIHTLSGVDHSEADDLDEFRESLEHLKDIPTAKLEHLLTETLDLCSHRLDAWITSFASKRLEQLREQNPNGIYLGGYGWVENLRPDPPRTQVEPPQGEEESPLYLEEDNGGFVHTPSLNHAATAAILRSSYLSQPDNGEGNPFAIDLSSERVRLAQNLLEGVRQGQSLGTLLGYRFERGLHERGLDRYIHSFRMLAPIGELYKARAALEAAEREVARVAKLPHPDLVSAKKVAAAAKKQHTQLLTEKSRLPSRLKNAQNKVVKIDADIKKTEALIKSLGNITGPGGKPIKSPGRVAAEKKLKTLKRQRASAVLSVSGLKKRQSQINADIAKARLNSEAAERIVKDKQKLPHPDLENAQKVEKNARDNYEKLLEEKRQRFLFSPTADVQAMESMAANNVVDGLALHRRYKKGISVQPQQWNTNSIPFGEIGLPKADTSPFKKILATLQSLDNALDAVSDALSAESVYHTVQGNPLRAGITLDTIIQDEAPPPELEVIRTPRSGIGLTHRILVLFSGLLADTASWPTNSQQVRAQAEPHLNAWAARLLGNPSKVRCQAEYLHPETDEVLAAKEVSLSELALSPLDILYMKPGSDEAQRSELEQRLVYHLMRTRAAKIPANCLVRLSFTRDDSWRTDDLSFAEFLEVARAVHKVVTGARAADARDLSPPEIATPLSVDLTELKSRADAATNSFQKVQKTLLALFKKAKTASLEDIRTVLISLAHFGIDGAIPLSFEGDTPEGREVLLTQAESIEKEINRRLDKLRTSDQAIDRKDVSAEEQRDHDLERLRTIFGDDFRVLPQFQPVNETELGQAFADSDVIQDGDPFAALNWFQRIARVRDGAARLDTAFMYAEAMGHTSTNLKVGQLPYQEADRWVALPISAERPLTGGRVSLVAHFPSGFNSPEPLAGLLIDEWVEVVPNTSETTGVAFNYDRPGAYPPQAILLAVPPDNREKWDMEVLEHIVLETLDLLKLRAVDPDALERVNGIEQFLPALDFAVNLAGDTVSTDFTRAAAQSKES